MQILGSCHCGNVSFTLHWRPEPTTIPARACDCSFCVKHGGVWTSCPTGSLEVQVRDAAHHTRYAFGTRTADFHVCTACGVVPVVSSQIDGHTYAVVNVNCFHGVDPTLVQPVPISFDGEDAATRLARRKQAWIAQVQFSVPPVVAAD
jgi:hypothetical protein